MYFHRHTKAWWFEPTIKKKRIRVPSMLMSVDPLSPYHRLNIRGPSKIGAFKHSRHWIRYNRLPSVDAGYITPLYDLRAIGMRYGLSENSMRYFRKHILPEPFDIVRRRAVQAHHWSRFTLMVLDVVLGDLQARGHLQFKSDFEDHIQLLHDGVAFLEDHYASVVQSKLVDPSDKFGVQWIE